ncbi:ABC transporter permease [Streptococcus sp. CSL10205-OR2]|uniref:ABC transporter permease n=1 Tax=Streptococcus sp. CSL10205-OR2 TaxID=2980558 RepID=UPI0021D83085|nr:ABC transporter permease [Streptococcus sp. CSL10205-OR2]MCU9533409.1 ABC transporter permease [Streptococcus sp. CSL10205-OR2]
MKKYIFNRILRSLVSIFLITTLIYAIIFTMVPRKLIFQQDSTYSKMAADPDRKTNYENSVFEKMGYIQYMTSKELQQAASEIDESVTVEVNSKNESIYKDYIKSIGSGWKLEQLPNSGSFFATREVPIYERVFKFYANLVQIDHPWKIQDETNPDLERYIRVENDPSIGWSVVGSGTKHKYLLYVNGSFPFIHQNFVTLNLGVSYPTYSNTPVLQVISQGQGQKRSTEVTFPNGKTMSSTVDIYSRTYQSPSKADSRSKTFYGDDPYSNTLNNYKDPSMIEMSARIGLVGIILAYAIALPLGSYMARFKNALFDRGSTAFLTFLMAIPSIALIYVVRFVGSNLGLPDVFPTLGAHNILSYVLPSLILAILYVPSLALWVRRYLIDLQHSDFVRFARAKGLSEKEIADKHIFKNAMVPIIAGVPGALLAVIVGATLTETIFAYPGMGKMLIDSVRAANNSMVVGLSFIFSALSIIALLLGDLLMTVLDPRIKLSDKGGK